MASPRLAFIFLWIFTDLVTRAFDSWIFPLVGFIFLPFTSVIYVLMYNPTDGISMWGWVVIVIAFLFDLGSYAGSAYSNKERLEDYT